MKQKKLSSLGITLLPTLSQFFTKKQSSALTFEYAVSRKMRNRNRTKSLKCLLFSVICLLALSANAKNITVEGEVDNSQKFDTSIFIDKSISIVYYNGLGVEDRITSQILNNGKFSLTFNATYPQVIQIQSGSGYYTEALVSPGQNLKLLLRYERCTVRTQGYPAIHYRPDFAHCFIGTGAQFQNSFIDFHIKLRSVTDSIYSKTELNNDESLNDQLKELPNLIHRFFASNPKYDPSLTAFANQEIAYRLLAKRMESMNDSSAAAGFQRINFPKIQYFSTETVNVIGRTLAIPNAQSVEFYKRSLFNNPRLHFTQEEQTLVLKSFDANLNKTDSLNLHHLSDRMKKDTKGMASVDSIVAILECEYFFKHLPGDIAEILTARRVMELKSDLINDFSYLSFEKKITHPELLNYLRYELKTKKAAKYVDYKKNTETDVISTLIKEFPNQNIYVDFWATWCGPCRAEFPYYPNVINKYKNEVVFVLLCVASEEHLYKEMISKLPFKAHHYFLNDIQYTKLKNEFKIVGIPHYLFINKSGKIINDFKRPSNLEGLQIEIDKEL